MPPSNLVDIDLELDILSIYKFPLIPNYDCSKATILIQKTVIVGMGNLPFLTWVRFKNKPCIVISDIAENGIIKNAKIPNNCNQKYSKDVEKWQTIPPST